MRAVIYKPQSVGWTSWVATGNPVLKLHHFLFELPELFEGAERQVDFTMLVGQVALVEYFKPPALDVEEPNYVPVVRQRLSNIIDLSTPVFTARVNQEGNEVQIEGAGCEVDYLARRRFPHRMKLRLDMQALCIPDRPARQLFSAMRSDMLWKNAEAFQQWLAGQRLVRDGDGLRLCAD